MRYWIGVACKQHVMRGVKEGIAQVCHGKEDPLKKMVPGDGLIYYSPTIAFRDKKPYQAFTALGKVKPGFPYPFEMHPNFIPFRRDVQFLPVNDVPIAPLIEKLSFITDKKKWGFPFRRGCFAIPEADFNLIAKALRP